MKKLIVLVLTLSIILSGCSGSQENKSDEKSNNSKENTTAQDKDSSKSSLDFVMTPKIEKIKSALEKNKEIYENRKEKTTEEQEKDEKTLLNAFDKTTFLEHVEGDELDFQVNPENNEKIMVLKSVYSVPLILDEEYGGAVDGGSSRDYFYNLFSLKSVDKNNVGKSDISKILSDVKKLNGEDFVKWIADIEKNENVQLIYFSINSQLYRLTEEEAAKLDYDHEKQVPLEARIEKYYLEVIDVNTGIHWRLSSDDSLSSDLLTAIAYINTPLDRYQVDETMFNTFSELFSSKTVEYNKPFFPDKKLFGSSEKPVFSKKDKYKEVAKKAEEDPREGLVDQHYAVEEEDTMENFLTMVRETSELRALRDLNYSPVRAEVSLWFLVGEMYDETAEYSSGLGNYGNVVRYREVNKESGGSHFKKGLRFDIGYDYIGDWLK